MVEHDRELAREQRMPNGVGHTRLLPSAPGASGRMRGDGHDSVIGLEGL